MLGGDSTKLLIQLPAPIPAEDVYRLQMFDVGPIGFGESGFLLLEPGTTSVVVNATVAAVDADQLVTITGRLTRMILGSFPTGSLPFPAATILVRPATLAKISAPVEGVPGGAQAACSVSLSGPAGPNGVSVNVTSLNTALAASPGALDFGSGVRTRTFNVATNPVDATGSVTLRAQFGGRTRTVSLSVHPALLREVALSAAAVSGGSSLGGNSVRLRGVAGTAGTSVVLASSHPSIVSVPRRLTVGAGKNQAAFKLNTSAVGSPTVVTIFAKGGGATASANLTVNP